MKDIFSVILVFILINSLSGCDVESQGAMPLSPDNCSELVDRTNELYQKRPAALGEPFGNAFLAQDAASAMNQMGFSFDQTIRSMIFVPVDYRTSCATVVKIVPQDISKATELGILSERTARLYAFLHDFGGLLSPKASAIVESFIKCEASISGPCPLTKACSLLGGDLPRLFEFANCDAVDQYQRTRGYRTLFDIPFPTKQKQFFTDGNGKSSPSDPTRDASWTLNRQLLKKYDEEAKNFADEQSKF